MIPDVGMLSIDCFDLLPDPILLLIFNKLCDIKSLGRCSAVSTRFRTLIPQVEDVVVKIDCVIEEECSSSHHYGGSSSSSIVRKGKGFFLAHLLRCFVGGFLLKPLHALQQHLAPKKKSSSSGGGGVLSEVSHHSPGEVLRSFKQVRNLRIELPGGELGVEEGALLKWRAEFGSSLERCVILSASSMVNCDKQTSSKRCLGAMQDGSIAEVDVEQAELRSGSQDDSVSIPESFFTDGGLKLRVVLTISSLIAASARHHLLQQIICEHPTLESLVLADAQGQGTLCMGKQQLRNFRDKPIAAASASSNRTQVPALNMKLWYAPLLELPGGGGMRGATLVDIRPSHEVSGKGAENHHLLSAAFEEPFRTAATSLIRRRNYLLEMNSF